MSLEVIAVSSIQTAPRPLSTSPSAFLPVVESTRQTARLGLVPACSLEFTIGDITTQNVDAIVNPVGAGLVDLAIRRAAGPALLEAYHAAVAELPEQKLLPGQAVITPGFGLAARHVIHCAPPDYADDPARARERLAACHTEALRLARERGLTSIAFPAIATGVYRYPAAEAAEVAIGAVVAAVRGPSDSHRTPGPRIIRFVLARPAMLERYAGAASER
jgi:O-acetyl-ADP-ribose deacetylase (regulator of RNase III)